MLSTSNIARTLLGLAAFLSTLFLPVWFALVFMMLLTLRWRAWEVLMLGLWIDFLWLPAGFFSPIPLYTLIALALFVMFEPLRRELLFTGSGNFR